MEDNGMETAIRVVCDIEKTMIILSQNLKHRSINCVVFKHCQVTIFYSKELDGENCISQFTGNILKYPAAFSFSLSISPASTPYS